MPIDSIGGCVRRDPRDYELQDFTQQTAPAPEKTGFVDQLVSANEEFIKYLEDSVKGNGDTQFDNPFDPNAPKLHVAASRITVGAKGASTGSSGPSLVGTAIKAVTIYAPVLINAAATAVSTAWNWLWSKIW